MFYTIRKSNCVHKELNMCQSAKNLHVFIFYSQNIYRLSKSVQSLNWINYLPDVYISKC